MVSKNRCTFSSRDHRNRFETGCVDRVWDRALRLLDHVFLDWQWFLSFPLLQLWLLSILFSRILQPVLPELLDCLSCWCYRCQHAKFDRPIHGERRLFRPLDLATIKFLSCRHNTVPLWSPAPGPRSPIDPTAYCSHATSITNLRTLAWAANAVFRIRRSVCLDPLGTISVARPWCVAVVALYAFQVSRCPIDLLRSTLPGTSSEVLAAKRTPATPRTNSSISVVTFGRRIASRCNASQQRTEWLAANIWCPIAVCISWRAGTHINSMIIKILRNDGIAYLYQITLLIVYRGRSFQKFLQNSLQIVQIRCLL